MTESIGLFLNKLRLKKGLPSKNYTTLFLLDGKQIVNLLDIPGDANVLVCTDLGEYKGVELEDTNIMPKIVSKNKSVVG